MKHVGLLGHLALCGRRFVCVPIFSAACVVRNATSASAPEAMKGVCSPNRLGWKWRGFQKNFQRVCRGKASCHYKRCRSSRSSFVCSVVPTGITARNEKRLELHPKDMDPVDWFIGTYCIGYSLSRDPTVLAIDGR